MPFQQAASLRYHTFETLPVRHAVFTRLGGASRGPYAQLNVGATVGDDPDHVRRNLDLAFAAVGRPRSSLFDSWLVHGTESLLAEAPRPPEWERPPQADIVLTEKPEVSLFMRYADCLPILLYDPARPAIGLAHAGWKGSVLGLAAQAVAEMQRHFGSKPADLRIAIGPGICTDHYEVGENVVQEVRTAFGEAAESLLPAYNGAIHFDLLAANRGALEETGVEHIEVADMCTASDTHNWFSHRAEKGVTGRFGVLLTLEDT